MIPPEELKSALLEAFPDAQIEISDLTGTQDHYRVRVISEAFRDVSPLQQHRQVYRALGKVVGAEIHALGLETGAP